MLEDLSRSLGAAAKILHGAELGHSGFLVGQAHVQYSLLLPHFTEARQRLGCLDWGQVVEFQKPDSPS